MATEMNSDENVMVQVIDESKGKGLFALRDFRKGKIPIEEILILVVKWSLKW